MVQRLCAGYSTSELYENLGLVPHVTISFTISAQNYREEDLKIRKKELIRNVQKPCMLKKITPRLAPHPRYEHFSIIAERIPDPKRIVVKVVDSLKSCACGGYGLGYGDEFLSFFF
jgi:hypothetical protein